MARPREQDNLDCPGGCHLVVGDVADVGEGVLCAECRRGRAAHGLRCCQSRLNLYLRTLGCGVDEELVVLKDVLDTLLAETCAP